MFRAERFHQRRHRQPQPELVHDRIAQRDAHGAAAVARLHVTEATGDFGESFVPAHRDMLATAADQRLAQAVRVVVQVLECDRFRAKVAAAEGIGLVPAHGGDVFDPLRITGDVEHQATTGLAQRTDAVGGAVCGAVGHADSPASGGSAQSSATTVSPSPGSQSAPMGVHPVWMTTRGPAWQTSTRLAPGTVACTKASIDAGMLTR